MMIVLVDCFLHKQIFLDLDRNSESSSSLKYQFYGDCAMRLGISVFFACGIVGANLLTFPSQAAGPSFDCAAASTPYEETVCSNSELVSLDLTLAIAYTFARENISNKSTINCSDPWK